MAVGCAVVGRISRGHAASSQVSGGTEIRRLSTGPLVVHRSGGAAGADRFGRAAWCSAAPGWASHPGVGRRSRSGARHGGRV